MNMTEYTEIIFGNIYLFDWLFHVALFLVFTFVGAFFYRFGIIYGVLFIAILPLSLFIRSIGIKIVESLSYLAIFHENYTPVSFLLIIAVCLVLNWLVVYRASLIDQITK